MDEPPVTRMELWRQRFQRLRANARRALPFVYGVLAAFVALLLYGIIVPGPHPLSQKDVNDTIAQAMASATAPPAYSSLVYQVIQPSLVLIQSQFPDQNDKKE